MSESLEPTAVLDPTPRIKLSSPADLVDTVPYLVGYPPKSSVVVVCVRDGLLRVTIRADLPPPAYAEKAAATLANHASRSGAQVVLLACYPEGQPERKTARRLVRALRRQLRRSGIQVKEAVRVENGRWWSYLCKLAACCPPEGTPVREQPGAAAAAAVFSGHVLQPSRDALANRLAAHDEAVLDEVVMHVVAAAERRPKNVRYHGAGPAQGDEARREDEGELAADRLREWRGGERTFIAELRDRYDADGGMSGPALTPAEAGRALFALADLLVRDSCALWWPDRERTRRSVGLFTDLVRHATIELLPAPATLLAGSAWLSGEGTFANLALELALKANPDYNLARLLEGGIQGGVTPEEMRETFDVPLELVE